MNSEPDTTLIVGDDDQQPVGVHETGAHKVQTNKGPQNVIKSAVKQAGAALKATVLQKTREESKNARDASSLAGASASIANVGALLEQANKPVLTTGAQQGVDEFSRSNTQANQAIYRRKEGERGRSEERKNDKKDNNIKGGSRSKGGESFSSDDL